MPEILGVLAGVAIVVALSLLTRADPRRLARMLRYLIVALAMGIGGFLAVRGLALLDLPLGAILFLVLRHWSARGFSGLDRVAAWLKGGPGGAGSSAIETPWLRMTLDRATGVLDGEVLAGRFAGAQLDRLGPAELQALHAECAGDAASIRLIETWLDRHHPAWREEPGARAPGSGAMSREQALQVLGLEPGAGAEQVQAAHRRLMMKLHPDHGGSTYLASQINAARDVLLGPA